MIPASVRLERSLKGAAGDLLLGGRPPEIVYSHAAPHEADLRISTQWLQIYARQPGAETEVSVPRNF
jgi:hypothetical protein